MHKLQQILLKKPEEHFNTFFTEIKDKSAEGENFRLLEYDIAENKDVFRMLSYLCFEVGMSETETRDFLQRITQSYFNFVRFSCGDERCSEIKKIKIFCREVIDRTLEITAIRSRLLETTPVEKFEGLSLHQDLSYRALVLLIPVAMREILTTNNLMMSVCGFDPDLIEE